MIGRHFGTFWLRAVEPLLAEAPASLVLRRFAPGTLARTERTLELRLRVLAEDFVGALLFIFPFYSRLKFTENGAARRLPLSSAKIMDAYCNLNRGLRLPHAGGFSGASLFNGEIAFINFGS
jgi:hypothetical protein